MDDRTKRMPSDICRSLFRCRLHSVSSQFKLCSIWIERQKCSFMVSNGLLSFETNSTRSLNPTKHCLWWIFHGFSMFRDCVTGNCVRLMTGHKSSVSTVVFSHDGRFLVTGGCDNHVLIWDIAHGHLLGDFAHHTAMVSSLCFSRCR